MVTQAGEDVIAILPHSHRHDQGSFRRNGFEYIHAHALIPNKAMLLHVIIWMRTFNSNPLGGKRRKHLSLHLGLSRPADLIGRQTQISTGEQKRFVRATGENGWSLRNPISC